MDIKKFTEEVKLPFYETYKTSVEEKGYSFGLGRGRNAPDQGSSLEVYVQLIPGGVEYITPQTLAEIQELVGHGKIFNDFYVNVRFIASAFALVDEKDF